MFQRTAATALAFLVLLAGGCGSSKTSWKNEANRRVQESLRAAFGEFELRDKPVLSSLQLVSPDGNAQSISVTGLMTVKLPDGQFRSFEYKASYVVREADKSVASRLMMIGKEYAFHPEVNETRLPQDLEPLLKVDKFYLDASDFP